MKTYGFKEWKLVCDAMERGEQTILLRKGGIAEGKHGFQWLHDAFFLFPTYFHEQEVQLRLSGPVEGAAAPTQELESIEIRLFAEIVETHRLTDLAQAKPLEPLHIWKPEVVEERFAWGDEPGLSLAVVRVSRLAQPWTLANRKGFGGCRSWLGLPAEEGLPEDWRETLVPVTSAAEIERVRRLIPAQG